MGSPLLTVTWWGRHAVHTVTLLVPAVSMAAVAVGADVRAALRRTRFATRDKRLVLAACGSFTAATVHAAVCPEHFREAAIYGAFMLAAASAQLAWGALALTSPRARVFATGIGLNAGIVALWALTRLVGIPLGPSAGEVEPVGILDALSTGAEVVVMVSCAALIRPAVISASRSCRLSVRG